MGQFVHRLDWNLFLELITLYMERKGVMEAANETEGALRVLCSSANRNSCIEGAAFYEALGNVSDLTDALVLLCRTRDGSEEEGLVHEKMLEFVKPH